VLREAFLDSAYAIALSAASDQYHDRALALATQLETDNTRLITTRAVLIETGNALAKQRYRAAAVQLLNALHADSSVEIIVLTDDLYSEAFALYQSRMDKDWGLTDCISFVVMTQRGLTDALTSDQHFEQAGFRALLRQA
jgi:uncharacterized protein